MEKDPQVLDRLKAGLCTAFNWNEVPEDVHDFLQEESTNIVSLSEILEGIEAKFSFYEGGSALALVGETPLHALWILKRWNTAANSILERLEQLDVATAQELISKNGDYICWQNLPETLKALNYGAPDALGLCLDLVSEKELSTYGYYEQSGGSNYSLLEAWVSKVSALLPEAENPAERAETIQRIKVFYDRLAEVGFGFDPHSVENALAILDSPLHSERLETLLATITFQEKSLDILSTREFLKFVREAKEEEFHSCLQEYDFWETQGMMLPLDPEHSPLFTKSRPPLTDAISPELLEFLSLAKQTGVFPGVNANDSVDYEEELFKSLQEKIQSLGQDVFQERVRFLQETFSLPGATQKDLERILEVLSDEHFPALEQMHEAFGLNKIYHVKHLHHSLVEDQLLQRLSGKEALLSQWRSLWPEMEISERDLLHFAGTNYRDTELFLQRICEDGLHIQTLDDLMCFLNVSIRYFKEIDAGDDDAWKSFVDYHNSTSGALDFGMVGPGATVSVWESFQNYQNVELDDKPVFLIVSSKSDHNSAIKETADYERTVSHYTHDKSLRQQEGGRLKENYLPIVAQVGSKEDLLRLIEDIGSRKKIGGMILHAHGQQQSMVFGYSCKGDTELSEEEQEAGMGEYLTVRDEAFIASLSSYFTPDADIILDSCTNGQGYTREENMTNIFARAFPGRNIYSRQKPNNSCRLSLGKDFGVHGFFSEEPERSGDIKLYSDENMFDETYLARRGVGECLAETCDEVSRMVKVTS